MLEEKIQLQNLMDIDELKVIADDFYIGTVITNYLTMAIKM